MAGRVGAMGCLLPLLALFVACGRSGSGNPVSARRDGGAGDAARVAVPALVLGMPDVAAFAYRERGGHPAFKRARDAEAKGDWKAVAAACIEALSLDGNHLDAAYLLAVARAKTDGSESQILEPLAKAVAGDFAKWANASLEQPALQRFLATPTGKAWRTRVETDQQVFLATLARSLLVTAAGDVFAFDHEANRWYRLTRTTGAVVATLAVRSLQKIAYVTRERATTTGKLQIKVGIGVVDLATGRARRPVHLAGTGPLRLAFNQRTLKKFVVRQGKDWQAIVDTGKLELEPIAATQKPGYTANLAEMMWLDVAGRTAQLSRTAVDNVKADWDEQSLASAIKIGSSHRVATVPSPGLIDGNTALWSPDRFQLAFVAQLDDDCTPGEPTAAAFVADAATGTVQELERAIGGIAIEWQANRKLAVAGDRGVTIFDLAGGAPFALDGADGLLTPRRKPKCAPEPVVEEPVVDEEPAEATDPVDAGIGK